MACAITNSDVVHALHEKNWTSWHRSLITVGLENYSGKRFVAMCVGALVDDDRLRPPFAYRADQFASTVLRGMTGNARLRGDPGKSAKLTRAPSFGLSDA